MLALLLHDAMQNTVSVLQESYVQFKLLQGFYEGFLNVMITSMSN